MDALIEFLFKYRPIVFQKGHLVFGTSWPTRLAVLAIGVAVIAAAATYTRVRMRGTRTDRIVLGAIRVLALVLLVLALLRPTLLAPAAVSQHNVVGVLVDDSRSMRLADMPKGQTRADVVRSLVGGPDSALYKALSNRFLVRLFRLSGGGSRVTSVGDLAFDGGRTRFAPALEGAREELAGAPIAGLVLASDGADNTPDSLSETLAALNARHIPVFTVGIGQEQFARDIEISRIDAPRTVLKGTTVMMDVDVTQRGYAGNTVQLVVEDEGHIVNTQPVTLPGDGAATTVRVRVPASEAGARLFTVRIAPQPGEMVQENNAQTALVTVQDRREKVLYVEGEPRFDLKFLHMAVDDDDNLQLVTMLRTSKDNKLYRLDIDNSNELAGGFPQTREELFGYRAIVLGSVEASFFSFDQLQMIADFVSERGGTLLMLGGPQAFAEGGYAGTPVADVLPVELPAGRQGKPVFHQVKVSGTPVGLVSAQLQIAGSENESARRWQTMPAVSSVNRIAGAKPGATVLMNGSAPDGGDQTIALAYQHYGRGKAVAFPVQDSWFWQMRSDTPLDDATYTTFWRQMLRWLVNDVPDRVTVSTSADRAWINEPLQITTRVADRAYHMVDNAEVTATITSPTGAVLTQRMEPSATRDGAAYHLTYTPTERGAYRVQVTARAPADTTITSAPTFVDVGTPTTEFIGAQQHVSLLQRMADETGGRYYTPSSAAHLAEDLVYGGGGDTTMERLDLWDMPFLLVLLLALLAGEWSYRRARGLA